MNLFSKIVHGTANYLFPIVYQIDELGNAIGSDEVFSPFGGNTSETISSTMGKALAVDLWNHRDNQNYDPGYPEARYPIGGFANWLCNRFQKEHALRSINWTAGVDIKKGREGIKDLVAYHLRKEGIKEA
jgi:hypothetical protein